MNEKEKEWDDWNFLSDTPEQFNEAIKNAVSENERIFYEKLRYKVLHEPAFGNEVLMHEFDNDEGLYILRVRFDEILIGKNEYSPGEKMTPMEFEGVNFAMDQDISEYVGRKITLKQWLRERDYKGIRYDRNNDLV